MSAARTSARRSSQAAAGRPRLHAGRCIAGRPVEHLIARLVRLRAVEPATAPGKGPEGAGENDVEPLQALAALAGVPSPSEASIADVTTQLMMADPETADQLRRYQEAVTRVEAAKAAAKQLEEEYARAGREMALAQAQEDAEAKRQADEIMAAAEVAAAEKLLAAAALEEARAEQARAQLAAQATQDADRIQSLKAGVVAAVGGGIAFAPLLLVAQDAAQPAVGSPLLSLGAALGSCFLFGPTYRYAVRGDVSNVHLRGGVVGAFGLVRAAAAADELQVTAVAGPLDLATVVGPAALYAGQSMILFAFASVALEAAFRQGFVTRFTSNR